MSLTKVTYSMIENGVFDITNYGAVGDGSTDDSDYIQAAIDAVPVAGGVVYFPAGTYRVTKQILIDSKPNIQFLGDGYASVIKPDNGSYIVMLFDNASGSAMLQGLSFDSGNYVNPTMTMVKMTGATAYTTIKDCVFSGCAYGLYLGETYVIKVVDNQFSNCGVCLYATNAEGSVADLLIDGNTFGTCLFGSDPLVRLIYNGVRFTNNYFETESKYRASLYISTNSQDTVVVGNQWFNSGGITIEASNLVTFTGNCMVNSYDSVNKYSFRVNGSAIATISGNTFNAGTLPEAIDCFSLSGTANIVGNTINGWTVGVNLPSSGSVIGNTIANCGTGIKSVSAAAAFVVGNFLSSNTTDINNGGTAANYALNYATTITDTSGGAGTSFGNTPQYVRVREYYANTTAATPGTLADGAGVTVTGFAPSGTGLGDVVMPSYDQDLQGVTLTAYMSSAGNVAYRFQNESGGSVTLTAGNLNAIIRKTS